MYFVLSLLNFNSYLHILPFFPSVRLSQRGSSEKNETPSAPSDGVSPPTPTQSHDAHLLESNDLEELRRAVKSAMKERDSLQQKLKSLTFQQDRHRRRLENTCIIIE